MGDGRTRGGGDGARGAPTGLDRYLASMQRKPLSRRQFLRVATIGPAAAYLAACSKSVGPGTSGPPATTATSTALEGELNVYNWASYLNPDNLTAFQDEYHVTATQDFYSSNEDLIAKLQAGTTGYDIVAPTGYAVQIMADAGLLLPLDKARIPNLSNVDDRFLGLSFDPDTTYAVPKDWGTTGFMYVSDQVTEDMTSWADFYDLAEKYAGKYTVLDSAPEVIGSALKLDGKSYNSADADEVDAAVDKLIAIKPSLAAILSSGYREMIQRGDTYVALGWNGDYFYTLEDQPSTKYVIPAEGTEYWVDTWAIPASAPHPNLAHEFINWIMSPEHQATETNYTYYASCVDAAKDLVDPAIAGDPAIYPAEEVVANLEANNGDPTALQLRTDGWTRFKSA